MATPRRIRKIQLSQIDRVPAGAQPDAHVALVKARRVPLSKLIDPASIDWQVQQVRQEFAEQYGSNYGCCSPCSGYVYIDAVYDGFVIACDSNGDYWRFTYTIADKVSVTFGQPEDVFPTVSWGEDPDADEDTPPAPISKALKSFGDPFWVASPADRMLRKAKNSQSEKDARAKRAPLSKERAMPETTTKPDLSALDDETRAEIEAALTERDTLKAAAEAVPAPVEDETADELETVEGLEKAIKKSRGQNRQLLESLLVQVRKSKDMEERAIRLEKAERLRLFKTRAQAMPHMAAHAAGDDGDAIGGMAALLERIDAGCGPDTCEAVEALLTKAHTQVHELLDKKGLLKSVGARVGGPHESGTAVVVSGDDPVAQVAEMVAELRKAKPDMTEAQAMTRVLDANRALYAEYEAARSAR